MTIDDFSTSQKSSHRPVINRLVKKFNAKARRTRSFAEFFLSKKSALLTLPRSLGVITALRGIFVPARFQPLEEPTPPFLLRQGYGGQVGHPSLKGNFRGSSLFCVHLRIKILVATLPR